MVALPIGKMELKCGKPKSYDYPADPKTVGDHVRRRRLDLGQVQADVAKKIGVTESSIWNWEKGGFEPELRYLPSIIAFLGYDPRPEPVTLPARLVWFREGKGWSQKRLAAELHVDPTTLARWERGERQPTGSFAWIVAEIVGVGSDHGRGYA